MRTNQIKNKKIEELAEFVFDVYAQCIGFSEMPSRSPLHVAPQAAAHFVKIVHRARDLCARLCRIGGDVFDADDTRRLRLLCAVLPRVTTLLRHSLASDAATTATLTPPTRTVAPHTVGCVDLAVAIIEAQPLDALSRASGELACAFMQHVGALCAGLLMSNVGDDELLNELIDTVLPPLALAFDERWFVPSIMAVVASADVSSVAAPPLAIALAMQRAHEVRMRSC